MWVCVETTDGRHVGHQQEALPSLGARVAMTSDFYFVAEKIAVREDGSVVIADSSYVTIWRERD